MAKSRTSLERVLDSAKLGDKDAMSQLLMELCSEFKTFIEARWETRWQSYLSVDDVLQESFAEAFLGIDSFHGSSIAEFSSWVKRICRNTYIDVLRHLKSKKVGGERKVSQPFDDISHLFLVYHVSNETPSRTLSRNEATETLKNSLQHLSPSSRRVISMVDLNGQSVAEVAGFLGCTIGAVHMRRRRAMTKLAEIIGSSVEI